MKKGSVSKHLMLIIFFAVTAAAILFLSVKLLHGENTAGYEMDSNAMRVEFLNSCGLIVKPDAEIQDITIPQYFGAIYEEYNELQKTQGFDLKRYAGEEATLYRYTVLNCPEYPENVTANMVICGNILIACDITLNEENGFTKALIPQNGDSEQ